jgi:GT2 family glycosyltransferase
VAVARNNGVAQAKGEIVLFIDDDVVPTPTLIVEHLKVHEMHGKNAIALGPMLTPPDFKMKPWVNWEQTMLMKQYDDMNAGKWQPSARQFYTGNTSLRKQHVIEAGGFDPRFRRAEDVELAYRLADTGLQFYFNMNAIGYHFAERSFASWIAIPYSYGRTDVVLYQEKGQRWLLPTIAREFHGRHPAIRALARLCLDKTTLSKWVVGGLKQVAWLGHKTGISLLPRFAYSGIFNLRHYQGVSDELGNSKLFLAQVEKAKAEMDLVYDERYSEGLKEVG